MGCFTEKPLADFTGFDMYGDMKKATTKTPINKLKKGDEIEHYNAVLLEDIKSKMEFVLEGMDVVKNELKSEMHSLDRKITNEIELLKTVIHKHSSDINWSNNIYKSLNNNIKENNLQITEVGKKLEDKIDKIGERIDDHETRITTLETARL